MLRKKVPALILMLSILFTACGIRPSENLSDTTYFPKDSENIEIFATESTALATNTETECATDPIETLHSELFLRDYTPEQIIGYFEEVVLDVEYSDGTGSVNLVKKWLSPIYYKIHGSATDTDLIILADLFEQLNSIPGFPGIYSADDISQVNVNIYFLDRDTLRDSFYDVINGEEADGAVQFWFYTLTNELHTARIGYCTDIDQSIRNSVLIEEIINMLGITDTVLREDSITYQYSSDNTSLSAVDWVILRLLYNPAISCGDPAEVCDSVIRTLYY